MTAWEGERKREERREGEGEGEGEGEVDEEAEGEEEVEESEQKREVEEREEEEREESSHKNRSFSISKFDVKPSHSPRRHARFTGVRWTPKGEGEEEEGGHHTNIFSFFAFTMLAHSLAAVAFLTFLSGVRISPFLGRPRFLMGGSMSWSASASRMASIWVRVRPSCASCGM